ncbi:hypothetical protein RIF29_28596 [Crotalaria pallida]|uniref:Uncharacterized protein n=1 Tax=Crotalaria pallida TaxID=3830 RepID=A0AAN9ED05_CROPI
MDDSEKWDPRGSSKRIKSIIDTFPFLLSYPTPPNLTPNPLNSPRVLLPSLRTQPRLPATSPISLSLSHPPTPPSPTNTLIALTPTLPLAFSSSPFFFHRTA